MSAAIGSAQQLPTRRLAARGLLIDLDDTLYDYAVAEASARGVVLAALASELGISAEEAQLRWDTARAAVKRRLGDRGSSHSRLLYLAELVHAAGRTDRLASVRAWERAYWTEFLRVARLRPGAIELLVGWRQRGGRVAIVTDLTLDIQLWKLEVFGLFPLIDVLVASEEVPADKPACDGFLLAAERLGLRPVECVVVGDSPRRDGGAAQALGMPYFQVVSSEAQRGGRSLQAIAEELGL